jgi:hypothetical protein
MVMEFFTLTTFQSTLLSVLAVSLCLHVLQAYRIRRTQRQLASVDSQLQGLGNDLRAMFSASTGVDKRLARMEKKVKIQTERQDKLELHEPNLQAYGQAAKMVRKGADADELVDTCGLSRGEAELIMFLNAEQSAHQPH